jgi:hypothetical protein
LRGWLLLTIRRHNTILIFAHGRCLGLGFTRMVMVMMI